MPAPPPARLFHPAPLPRDRRLDAAHRVRLDADTSHHALRVLRLVVGDAVELFDGGGLRWPARLLDDDARGATVELGEPFDAATEGPIAIGLAQVLPAGDRMDWIVEKAVELGAIAIQPLASRRSVIRLDAARAAKRRAHWARIAVAACMQCGRDRVPAIGEIVALAPWLDGASGPSTLVPEADAARVMLTPHAVVGLDALGPSGATPRALWLLAGPEGGFDDDEHARALAAGWRALRLGPRVLRTETAGLAALAAVQTRFGDFR